MTSVGGAREDGFLGFTSEGLDEGVVENLHHVLAGRYRQGDVPAQRLLLDA